MADPAQLLKLLRGFFTDRGWEPFPFQEETWRAYREGHSGLVHVPTGAGKTYSAVIGPIADIAADGEEGLQLVFITPLRAMSRDITRAIAEPVEYLARRAAELEAEREAPEIRVEMRTGDTSQSQRRKQRKKLPQILVTTPESLAILLSYSDAPRRFKKLRAIVIDEWHELLSSKRGTLLELCLSRLRALSPASRSWALSATLSNIEEAALAATGVSGEPVVIRAKLNRPIDIDTVLPDEVERFPWAGHLGLNMLPEVLAELDPERSTLVFTNTRSQAERWYQSIVEARPEWAAVCALHHGSIDRQVREDVEAGMKSGDLRIVVCTSSLDLGVDFSPVERVFQIGSPKGVARMIQRAGRSGHRPGERCRLSFVPTHALELAEIAAVRDAIEKKEVEPRRPMNRPLDVLVQHMVTCALGGGFVADELFEQVRSSVAFAELTRAEFEWSLELVRDGGKTLRAYDEYKKVVLKDGRYVVESRRLGRLHRMNIGTIVSDGTMRIRFVSGGSIGTINEAFVSRLRPGQQFVFGGRRLEFVRTRGMTAYVKLAKKITAHTPHWAGTRLPISESLSSALRRVLGQFPDIGTVGSESVQTGKVARELMAARPIFDTQRELSELPGEESLLVELCKTREGHHCFLYPFEGRAVHEGLAALLALRLTRIQPATFRLTVNDYGLELLSRGSFPFEETVSPALFTTENLLDDIVASLNISELAKRQFREVARVSGLVFQRYPGTEKATRHLQASASLIYDVFVRYDEDNLLVQQARREVMEKHFEQSRLGQTLERLRSVPCNVQEPPHPTPLAFPLMVDRFGSSLSGESLSDRILRTRAQLEKRLDKAAGQT